MATLSRDTLVEVNSSYQTLTAGQSAGFTAASAGGDLIPISSGRGTIIRFRTSGTAVTVTLDSARPSNYGQDNNVTISLAATDEKEVFIANDGVGRFDQGGANTGLLSVTYSAVTGLTVAAKTVP